MATILVVDDDFTNRQVLSTLLGYRAHKIVEAADGQEGLEKTQSERPDLAIVDIVMPTMDGFEFVRQLRSNPAIAKTPVIFYTAGYYEREIRSLAQDCGVFYILTKPAEPQVIIDTVDAALGLAGLPLDFPRPEQFDREHLRVTTDKLSQKVVELETVTLRLGRVIEIGRELASEHDADRLTDTVSRSARKVIGAALAGVGIINDDGRKLLQYRYYGMSADKAVALTAPAVDHGVIHTILTERRPVRLRNLDGSPEDLGLPADHPPIYSFLGVPIASSPRLYGWLALKNKIGSDEFTAEDENLAVSVAAQMAVAFENIQRYNEIQNHAEKLEQQVNERTADLKRSNAELEQFAYVASHDLQEPLRKILGFTDLLAEKLTNQLDDDGKEYMSYVTGAAGRMRDLIQDLLTYSRAGKQTRKAERVDCQAVLSRVLLDLQPAIEEHAAIVTNGALPILSADATQLVQLFQNLIGNALKYHSNEPPRIHIETKQINQRQLPTSIFQVDESEKFATSNPDSAIDDSPIWLFSVGDNGIGIDAKYSERIFRVFQRLHSRAEYPGTGIGLAICKKIVEGYGGHIWIESAAGQGSTFYFTLPAAQAGAPLGAA